MTKDEGIVEAANLHRKIVAVLNSSDLEKVATFLIEFYDRAQREVKAIPSFTIVEAKTPSGEQVWIIKYRDLGSE